MRIRTRKTVSYFLSFVLLLCAGIMLGGCGKKANSFSEEEHIQRISERIEKTNLNLDYPEGETYQDFEVYPLYNKNEELKYCLVEFEPYGFLFVSVRDEPPIFTSFLYYPNKSMYLLSHDRYSKEFPWTPYVRNKNSPTLPNFVEGWATQRTGEPILDENGNLIIYDKSPYFVTGNTNEKKYLLETDVGYEFICAVKKDGKFINLISGLELLDLEEYSYEDNATLEVGFIPHRSYDL